MVEQIVDMTGVSLDVARQALETHKEVWLAIDALLERPKIAGDKYMPSKPKTDTGLTDEQKERCEKGRWLQDQINAVFSVSHPQTQRAHAPATALDDQVVQSSSS